MNIAILGTGSNLVPPKNYGGVQAVNYVTAKEFVKLGHTVYLFAPQGSKTSGTLITIDSGWGEHTERNNTDKYVSKYIDKVDVLIDTTAFAFPGRRWKELPYLNRLGGDTKKIYCKHIDRNTVFPSKAHLKHHSVGDCVCSKKRTELGCETPVVYKPVCFPGDIKDIPCSDSRNNKYYLCFGLVSPHKGTHFSVKFATKAGVRLRVVGPIGDNNYFNKKIKPYLNDKITYESAVSFEDKWDIFNKAIATLFTTNCEEGGPNVPLESMLTGTPVIAFNRSTVTEYVDDGKTGLLCKSIEEMCDRLPSLNKVAYSLCRNNILSKFSVNVYIDKYLKLIKKVIKGEQWI